MKMQNVAQVEGVPTKSAGPRNLRLGRTLLAFGLAAGLFVGAPTSRASAAVSLTNGASAWTSISCEPSLQWFDITVNIQPQAGFSRQSVAYAFYVQPNSGAAGAWSAWHYGTAPMQPETKVPLSGMTFTVYMRYAWWTGSSWLVFGEWINTYTEIYGSARIQQGYCQV